MTKVKGGVPIRRVPRTPSVVIQAGQRVFHKLPDGTYEPATITLRAVVQNVTNPRYQWGRILNGNFRTYNVTLEAMTINPAHAGVVAVRVEGDNIPGYIQATESISIVEDGAPAVQYKIVVSQLGRVVTSIPCDDQGNPKIYYQATASLYKIIGSKEEPCGDFLCVIAYYKGDSIVKSDISPGYVDNYTFIVEGDCDSVRIGFSDGENVIVETTVPKVCDGSQGIPGSSGYTYRPRGMFTPGDTYVYNDMYRDIVLSWFNSRLHTFRVKVKGSSVTVRPTSSNGDDNWEVANELKFIATDLLLAQNAIVNLLQGNEVRVLDGNGIATAGMSGSGSGDSGIRFYAGSDDPQTAPFRVDENGKVIANNIVAYGSVATPFIEITDDNYEEYSVMYPDNTGIFINISNKHGFNYKIGNHLSIEPVVISLPYDYDNDGVEVNIASYRTLISYAIIVGVYDINKQKEINVILNPIDLVRLKCVVLERGNSNDSDDIKKQNIKWIHLSGGASN